MPLPDPSPLTEARSVSKLFPGAGGQKRVAVDAVSLTIAAGEVVGLVGESGSGKSTLGRMMIGLASPSTGDVLAFGQPLAAMPGRELNDLRRRFQIVFQNPAGALSPRRTVGQSLAEPLVVQGIGSRQDRASRIAAALGQVGLAADHAGRYPHELSGGQRQRVSLARALILDPDFIVADEPVSALDVSIQAQVLNLFQDLRAATRLAMLFISHDLAVVNYLADRVCVMHHGRIVEMGPREAIIFAPRHPYTRQLLAARTTLGDARDAVATSAIRAAGEGCGYAASCALRRSECLTMRPELAADGNGHSVACHVMTGPQA